MLKFLAIAVLLLVGTPTPSSGGMLPGRHHDSRYFLFYIYEKAANQCYGDNYMRDFNLKMRNLFAKCYQQADLNIRSSKYSRNIQSLYNKETSTDILLDGHFIQKGVAPFYSANVIRALKNDVFENVGVVSCVFDNLKLSVSSNGKVDATSIIRGVQENTLIPSDVKFFLLDGVKTCEANSNKGDYLKWGKKYEEFFKKLEFFRCTELQKMLSCMKADLKKDADNFDLSGLDGALDDADVVARRWFVASSYSNWDTTGILDH